MTRFLQNNTIETQDGADLQHCGPDEDAEDVRGRRAMWDVGGMRTSAWDARSRLQIWYADGTRYRGPCLAGAQASDRIGVVSQASQA